MSEEHPLSPPEPSAAPVRAPQTPGEWLRAQREIQGRTVQEIAEEMHLGVHMVEAMEHNQFTVLGAPVFARGHLRKYATLLGMPVERVQELYQAVADRPRDEDPVPVMHRLTERSIPMSPDSQQRRASQLPAQYTIVIACGALLLVGVLVWLLIGRNSAPESTVDAPVESTPPSVEPQVVAAPPVKQNTPVVQSAPVATPPPSATARPTPVRAKVNLRFTFSEESWVEVHDGRGTRLLYDVVQPGQSRSVQVDPPAQVVLGLASGVITEVNGHVVEVPERRISNQVGKFSVNADGVVQ